MLGVDPFAPLGLVERIGNDVGALRNLTQEGTDLANALWVDRKDVAYGCIVTGTNQPAGLIDTADPILYMNTVLFRVARALAAVRNPVFAYSSRAAELQSKHDVDRDAGLDVGRLFIDDRTSDGIVPSASQVHGTLLGVFESDHLDCVGQFPRKLADGTRVSGWVRSGAKFTNKRFELLWSRVAEFIAAAHPQAPKRRTAGSPQRRRRARPSG